MIVENLEVAEADLGIMTWDEAVDACAVLGEGWRLPTKDELNLMYMNLKQKALGGFGEDWLWSSSQNFSSHGTYGYGAWIQRFSDGLHDYYYKSTRCAVRAVRAVELESATCNKCKYTDDYRGDGTNPCITCVRHGPRQTDRDNWMPASIDKNIKEESHD